MLSVLGLLCVIMFNSPPAWAATMDDERFTVRATIPDAPPANDDCENAETLTINTTVSGTMNESTRSIDDCYIVSEVWYTITGTGSAIEVNVETDDLDLILKLYSGDNCSDKLQIGGCYDEYFYVRNESFSFNSTAGEVYYIAVGAFGTYPIEGAFTITASQGCGPVDQFMVSEYPDATSLKLTWEEPADDAEYEIQYGEIIDPWTPTTFTSIQDVSGTSYLLTGLQPNTGYEIRIRTICGEEDFSDWRTIYETTIAQSIANDVCSGAISLGCGNDLVDQPLSNANVDNDIVFDDCSSNYPGVWYTYSHSSSSDQDVKISLSDFDPKMFGIGLRLIVSVMTGNGCDPEEMVSCFQIDKYSDDNKIFTAHPGENYYILVSSPNLEDYSNVTFDLSIACGDFTTEQYGNDICANALSMECDGEYESSTSHTTDNLDYDLADIGRGRWYTFTGDGKTVTLKIESQGGVNFNGYLASGSCSSLTTVALFNQAGDEEHTFTTTNGTVYYLYVGAEGNDSYETGDYKLSMTCVECLPVTLLSVLDDSDREALVSWDYKSGFTDWTIKLGFLGFDPDTEGLFIPNSSVKESIFYYLRLTGLEPNTHYDLYVRANCDGENQSEWIKTTILTSPLPSINSLSCGDRFFYDTGNQSGNYENDDDYGVRVSGSDPHVLFIRSDIEDNSVYECEDYLTVHNGSDFDDPAIVDDYGNPYWCGSSLGGELFEGSGNDLTFRFHSNGTFTEPGWEALVACDGDFARTNLRDECITSNILDDEFGEYRDWYHLYSEDGVLIASVQIVSGSLNQFSASAFISSEVRQFDSFTPYLNRSFTLHSGSSATVRVRLYFSDSEANDLIGRSSGATGISDFKIIQTGQECGEALDSCKPRLDISGNGSFGNTPYIEFQTNTFGAFYVIAESDGVLDFSVQDTSLTLDENGSATISEEDLLGALAENCHIKNIEVSPLIFGCDEVGINTVTIEMTTIDDQIIQKEVKITIIDTEKPVFTNLPESNIVISDPSEIPEVYPVGYRDNCSATIRFQEQRREEECGLTIERLWVITDPSGNEASFTQSIQFDGGLKEDLRPVAAHMTGISSGDTLHVIDCLPYDIAGSDLNAGDDPNARVATHVYRLELPSEPAYGMMSLYEYVYDVTNGCGRTFSFVYYLALYDLNPPEFRSFPEDLILESWSDLPSVDDQVRILDVCSSVAWDTVYTLPVLDTGSNDTLSIVRRWVAVDPSGNFSFRDQYFNIRDTKRTDYGKIRLRIGKAKDIADARFEQGAGTNNIRLDLLKYEEGGSWIDVESMITGSWNGQKGSAFFDPILEGLYRIQIRLPEGYSVKRDSIFTKSGLADSLVISAGEVLDLGLITLLPEPPALDSLAGSGDTLGIPDTIPEEISDPLFTSPDTVEYPTDTLFSHTDTIQMEQDSVGEMVDSGVSQSDTIDVVSDSVVVEHDTTGIVTGPHMPKSDTADITTDEKVNTIPHTTTGRARNRITSKVYPNPSTGIFNISVDFRTPVHYSIYSISGQLIQKGQFIGNIEIDLSSSPGEVYTLLLYARNEGIAVEKVVILK